MFKKEIYNQKMQKTLEVFNKELGALRTGRANANMLDLIKVDVYGQKMPINQLATISVPEPRTINVQVWDMNNVPLIDSAIKKSELGLNPQIEGQLIRLPIPGGISPVSPPFHPFDEFPDKFKIVVSSIL